MVEDRFELQEIKRCISPLLTIGVIRTLRWWKLNTIDNSLSMFAVLLAMLECRRRHLTNRHAAIFLEYRYIWSLLDTRCAARRVVMKTAAITDIVIGKSCCFEIRLITSSGNRRRPSQPRSGNVFHFFTATSSPSSGRLALWQTQVKVILTSRLIEFPHCPAELRLPVG